MRECFGIDLDARRDEFIFAGDSPNDAPMFAYFPHSVGVANIKEFASRLSPRVHLNEKIDVARLELDYDSDYA